MGRDTGGVNRRGVPAGLRGMGAILLVFVAMTGQMQAQATTFLLSEDYADRELLNMSRQQETGYSPFQLGLLSFEEHHYARALQIWLPLAEAGNTDAQFQIGVMFEGGLGVRRSPEIAVHWYAAAALNGHASAQHNLAAAYSKGEGVNADMSMALYWWSRSANQGNTDSQYNLGVVYATGKGGVKPDLVEAERWWQLAANHDDAMAQYNLGALYVNGSDSATRLCEAEQWWQRSARNGLAQANQALQLLRARTEFAVCKSK